VGGASGGGTDSGNGDSNGGGSAPMDREGVEGVGGGNSGGGGGGKYGGGAGAMRVPPPQAQHISKGTAVFHLYAKQAVWCFVSNQVQSAGTPMYTKVPLMSFVVLFLMNKFPSGGSWSKHVALESSAVRCMLAR